MERADWLDEGLKPAGHAHPAVARKYCEDLAKGHHINKQSSMDGRHYPRHVTNYIAGKIRLAE